MRLFSIEIERFCGIKSLTLELENSLQLIAGPNNSCKSTILKAIDYFFSNFEGIAPSEYEPQNNYYKQETKSTTKIRLHFRDLNDDELLAFGKFWLPKKKEIWFELRLERKGSITYSASGSGDAHAGFVELQNRYQVIYIPAVRAGTTDLRAVETRKLFVTTKSVLSRKKRGKLSSLQKSFSAASDSLTIILDTLLEESRLQVSESLPAESDIKFKFPTSDEVLDLILSRTTVSTRSDTRLTIDDEGTGFQSLLSLGLLKYIESVEASDNLLFLVEEPEAFLHPHYQRTVSDYLKKLSKKSQVIVTTHSSILVDSVDLVHIARLIKGINGLDYSWKWDPSDLDKTKYLSRYCDAKNSEIIFSDKVILCEGISDKNVICEIYRQLFKLEHHSSNISVISGDGTAIRQIAQLIKLFSIESLVVMDKDAYATDKRDTLQKICQEKNLPLTDSDYKVLNRAKVSVCKSHAEANSVRDEVNAIMEKRSIFILGGDIEASVTHSFSRAKILEFLGPNNLNHLKNEVIAELNALTSEAFVKRLDQLIGSKGWNSVKPIKENKPKPHVLHNFIELAGIGSFKQSSDMSALAHKIKNFSGLSPN